MIIRLYPPSADIPVCRSSLEAGVICVCVCVCVCVCLILSIDF